MKLVQAIIVEAGKIAVTFDSIDPPPAVYPVPLLLCVVGHRVVR